MQVVITITTPAQMNDPKQIDFTGIKDLIRLVPVGREATINIPPSDSDPSHIEVTIKQG